MNDKELVSRMQHGDMQAFDELYERYKQFKEIDEDESLTSAVKDAAKRAAAETGQSRNDLYHAALVRQSAEE